MCAGSNPQELLSRRNFPVIRYEVGVTKAFGMSLSGTLNILRFQKSDNNFYSNAPTVYVLYV